MKGTIVTLTVSGFFTFVSGVGYESLSLTLFGFVVTSFGLFMYMDKEPQKKPIIF
jgi:hypothetical protein